MSVTSPGYQFAQMGMYPDPTQWSNPYSNFNNQALPFPPGYMGTPVNAGTGQPIQGYQPPPQGMTLNSAPLAAPQAQGPSLKQQYIPWNEGDLTAALLGGGGMGGTPTGGQNAATQNIIGAEQNMGLRNYSGQGAGSGMGAGGMQPASQAGSYQAALNALSNPGNPITPGAAFTPQQSTAGGGQGANILNNFIQNWQQGGIGRQAAGGIGGGSSQITQGANNPFFAALGATK